MNYLFNLVFFPFLLNLILSPLDGHCQNNSIEEIPVYYEGRFRPLEAASQMWMYQIAKQSYLDAQSSAATSIFELFLLGYEPFQQKPIYYLSSTDIKRALNLDIKTMRFSYSALKSSLQEINSTKTLLNQLLAYHFSKTYFESQENKKNVKESYSLPHLSSGLKVGLKGDDLVALAPGNEWPFSLFKSSEVLIQDARHNLLNYISNDAKLFSEQVLNLIAFLRQFERITEGVSQTEQNYLDFYQSLKKENLSPQHIQQSLETSFPLKDRLELSSQLIKIFPLKKDPSIWVSLKALDLQEYDPASDQLKPLSNFSLFSDKSFKIIQEAYTQVKYLKLSSKDAFQESLNTLAKAIITGFEEIEGKDLKKAHHKTYSFPNLWQVKLEYLYYRYPIIHLSIALYFIAALALTLSIQKTFTSLHRIASLTFICAFLIHTLILTMRCLILKRAPVSNMFETILYVPWIGVIGGYCLSKINSTKLPLIASCITSFLLLIVLSLSNFNEQLENVQAVLDSQYWLIIHVMMVVGSYGLFFLSGVLGHIYLVESLRNRPFANKKSLSKLILHSQLIGTGMLIPGTILGGVWALESWGRFWDWDPKESWAFISSCVYLAILHLYLFGQISDFGLAIGSVIGLLAVSFTWYGVNYILGTGLHSYGFGNGGEYLYYLFILAELVFLCIILSIFVSKKRNQSSSEY